MASNYTQPPPSYSGQNKMASNDEEAELQAPLLPRAGPSAGFGGYHDQPLAGDVPDDFKVRSLRL